MGEAAMDRAARLARARAALESAELATGLRPVDWASHTARRAAPAVQVEDAPAQVEVADASWLAMPDALSGLLPHGAVRRGSSLVVAGSTSLTLHTAAALAAGGAWCAMVSHPDVGLAAAIETGVDPARTVLVPEPLPDAPEVLGAVVDGFDVVAVGWCTALCDRDQRALSQRVRHRGAVLLSTQSWAGSELTLTATARAGRGLSTHGRLVGESLTATSTGRGLGAGRTRTISLTTEGGITRMLPAQPGEMRAGPALVELTKTG